MVKVQLSLFLTVRLNVIFTDNYKIQDFNSVPEKLSLRKTL